MSNNKGINWFERKYPDIEKRYWAVSKYITAELAKNRPTYKLELLEFIRRYTLERTGLDPLIEAMAID